jgi:hypothetical protein
MEWLSCFKISMATSGIYYSALTANRVAGSI